ncbi:hypothetical protein [uncultured Pseudomonas sp.]|uniref:hypothetical protein n=1 Tax=uncultured Pseudomonas sp. TaxID=114707 RepID=UPI0026115B5F|nr:hypothetical protein [uncultured Pseudomonas sp.]
MSAQVLVDVFVGNKIYSQVDPNKPEEYVAMGLTDAQVAAAVEAKVRDDALENRRIAYVTESDRLYMEWQYDQTEAAENAWRDKVAEIKARYPLPGE